MHSEQNTDGNNGDIFQGEIFLNDVFLSVGKRLDDKRDNKNGHTDAILLGEFQRMVP